MYIYESILFGFPGDSDYTIVVNYCILYTNISIKKNCRTKIKTKRYQIFPGVSVLLPQIHSKCERKNMYLKHWYIKI